ncbi:unnamed protein product [Symbiodinium natans]|uniref:Uncharacterized protein n=1 Tax=Symbiodinium natans TaxID=878477 RepID=A0A812U3E3_9DINO|nr:unnamed protein product [Symbiodinium natans]
MVCSLCGSKKHNLRTCTLPGAAQHRSMHRELLKLKGAVPNAQAGRKPRRLGAPTTGRFQAQRSLRYSGSGRAKLRKAVANKKRAKTVGLTQTSDGQLQAVKDLRRDGFLPAKPLKCMTCRGPVGQMQLRAKGHVWVRCIDTDCRVARNVLSEASWLPDVSRQPWTPMQLQAALRLSTAGFGKQASTPYALARSLGTTYKPTSRFLEAVRSLEAAASEKLNARTMLDKAVEVDGTCLRTLRVSRWSKTYANSVQEWQAKHAHQASPDYFLLHLRALGATQRGTQKCVFVPAPLRLVPAGSVPPPESCEDVLCTRLLKRIRSQDRVEGLGLRNIGLQ